MTHVTGSAQPCNIARTCLFVIQVLAKLESQWLNYPAMPVNMSTMDTLKWKKTLSFRRLWLKFNIILPVKAFLLVRSILNKFNLYLQNSSTLKSKRIATVNKSSKAILNFLKTVTPPIKGLLKVPCLTKRLSQKRSRWVLHFKSSIFILSSYSGGKISPRTVPDRSKTKRILL